MEKIRAAGDAGATIIPNFATAIIVMARSSLTGSKVVMSGFTISKGDALNRGNYRDLKLIKQAMKILDRWPQSLSIDDSHFSFSPGRGATDAIFVIQQLQVKYLTVNKQLYMAFEDLEKAQPMSLELERLSDCQCPLELSAQSLLFIIVLEALSREFFSGVSLRGPLCR